MNQILVTKTIYVTPELKRKKKIYKGNLFLSIFLVCLLFSYYIYAEYDRNKNEEISKEILSRMDLVQDEWEDELYTNQDSSVQIEDNVLIVNLNEQNANRAEIDITDLARETQEQITQNKQKRKAKPLTYTAENGQTYNVDCVLNIPSLEINYPVLQDYSEENLKISITKFWGGKPNEAGNYVIAGHNYRNKKMFGKLSQIKKGDICELTDYTGRTIKYSVYETFIVDPDDTSCTSQLTNGKKEITLITCTNYGKQRLIVKAREMSN